MTCPWQSGQTFHISIAGTAISSASYSTLIAPQPQHLYVTGISGILFSLVTTLVFPN